VAVVDGRNGETLAAAANLTLEAGLNGVAISVDL
jgi:hypothetical protein